MTFKGLLNEKIPSNFQTNIKKKKEKKEKKLELRQSTETIKLALIGELIYKPTNLPFLKYATTLYDQAPKQIQEAENYCDVAPRF